jgi:TPR repeat protein
MHTRRNVEEVFNVFQEHKTLVIQDYVEACVWYQKAADAGDKKALAKLMELRRRR